ncbi:MAG: FGGY family carbohydrate kinase, partial [Varibaculum cambriense]|nr:FGGY family carbohydrate kinase [Varibaculum cambriense]
MTAREDITGGEAALGIEFGSTNIKAVLLGKQNEILATGNHAWQNQIVDGFWSYSTEEIISGLQACYSDLAGNVAKRYHTEINSLASIGISAMMHGYLAFDSENHLLTPFRTWRNTNTGEAANRLSSLFDFNVPMRWSIAHLYQAILDGEAHVQRIHHLNTLAGYVHWLLTNQLVLGVGDASGMF